MTYTTLTSQSDYSNSSVENGQILIAPENTADGIVLHVKKSDGTTASVIDLRFNGIETALQQLSSANS